MNWNKTLAASTIALFIVLMVPISVVPVNSSGPVADGEVTTFTKMVTLITGDKVQATPLEDGRFTIAIIPSRDQIFKIISDGKDTYVIPESVEQFIGNILDMQLFNIDYLIENGYCDTEASSLPLIIEYSSNPGREHAKINAAPGLLKKVDYETIYASSVEISKEDLSEFANAVFYTDEGLEGVDKIWLDGKITLTLDESVPGIGAPYAWAQGYDGTGIKIAILDTGIWKDHPDLIGKVVAEQDFTRDGTTNDLNGHGTHVAGIVAANGVIKGVAPGALIINVKVLGADGTGQVSWAIAGFEWAANQGAKVFCMSFGAAPTDGTGPMDKALNAIVDKYNIVAVAAAGNGKTYYKIASPAAADNAIAVGAATKPGLPKLSVVSPEARDIQANLMEYSLKPPVEGIERPIVYAGLGSVEDFAHVNVMGKIALIQRGVYTFKEKVMNAANAGAVAAIIFNNVPGNFYGTLGEPGPIPAVSISMEDGNYLLGLLESGEVTVNLRWDPKAVAIAGFSSRGPRLDYKLKPEIVAPGVAIKSTVPTYECAIWDPSGYKTLSGTSMAAPHVAGAAALLIQKYPKWSWRKVRDALMCTAKIEVSDPYFYFKPIADIYTQGSGLVAVDSAIDAEVIFDPAVVSFGKVSATLPSLSRSFTIVNDGNEDVTLELNVEKVHDIRGNTYDIATIDSYIVTIPAKRSARITLMVNLQPAPINIPLAGRITAKNIKTGENIHAIFGFYKELTHELNIKMINPNGEPWADQTLCVWDIYSSELIPFIYVTTDSYGEAKLNLVPGYYNIFYYGRWGTPTWPIYTIYWLYSIEEPLFENRTVILDGRQAQPVTLNIVVDQTIPRGSCANWLYKPSTVNVTYSFSYTAGHWRFHNYVLQATAKLGDLNMLFRFEEVRGKEITDLYPIKSPVVYDLFYTMVGEITGPVVYTVDNTTLQKMALVKAKHFSTTMNPKVYWWGSFAFATEFLQPAASAVWTRYLVPIERDEYLTPNTEYIVHVTPGELGPLTFIEPNRIYRPGEIIEKTWLQQLLKPWTIEASRKGNSILVRGSFTDAELHVGDSELQNAMSFKTEVYKDDVLIYSVSDRYLWYQTVTPEEANYRIELYSRNKPYIGGEWSSYSIETFTTIKFRSKYTEGVENLPIINLNYKIPGLRLNNVKVVSKKDPLIIQLIPQHLKGLDISGMDARFWYSFDDGVTWIEAGDVVKGTDGWIVKLTNAKDNYISIKTLVIDIDGNSIEQIIIRAFYVTTTPQKFWFDIQ